MRINRLSQYGILFVLYLSQAGRATAEGAAEGLNLSRSFLDQVARKLRVAGVIKSVRGCGGGYEVVGAPTVEDVLDALSPVSLLTSAESTMYALGAPEHRAFANYCKNLENSLSPVLKRKVSAVGKELVANEMACLERAQPSPQVN